MNKKGANAEELHQTIPLVSLDALLRTAGIEEWSGDAAERIVKTLRRHAKRLESERE